MSIRQNTTPFSPGTRNAAHSGALLRVAVRIPRKILWWLRQVFGDADYENYLRRAPRAPMSATEFYLDRLHRKHSRINRCC